MNRVSLVHQNLAQANSTADAGLSPAQDNGQIAADAEEAVYPYNKAGHSSSPYGSWSLVARWDWELVAN